MRSGRWTMVTVLCVTGLSVGAAVRAADAPAATIHTKDNTPATPKLEDLPLQESLTSGGITWTFDQPARVGRFLTGDWYIVGPVTLKTIDPKPLFGDQVKTPLMEQGDTRESIYGGQLARNGSVLNLPAVVPPNKITKRIARAGFDSRLPMAQYDADQFAHLPISIKPGDSLVSSISEEPLKYGGYPVKALAVLTCLAEPQPPDAFRPSFCQTASSKIYLARNLRRDLLLKLPRPASAAGIAPQTYASWFGGLWIDTVGFGRAMPRQPFQFNGAGIAGLGGGASLLLLLDYPPAEKEPLLVNMVQVGIDLYGLVRGGGGWPAEGICGSGRKWLIVFAGLMLDDPQMAAVHKTCPAAEFQEDEQTAFLPMEHEGRKFDKTHQGAKVFWTGHYGIRHGQFLPNKWASGWGPTDLYPPSEWPSPWPRAESDRRSSSSPQWVGQALAARFMHAEKVWAGDAFFAYVDRWMTEDDTAAIEEIKKNWDDQLAAKAFAGDELARQQAARAVWKPVRQGTIFGPDKLPDVIKELWTAYRDHLPPAPDGIVTPKSNETWK